MSGMYVQTVLFMVRSNRPPAPRRKTLSGYASELWKSTSERFSQRSVVTILFTGQEHTGLFLWTLRLLPDLRLEILETHATIFETTYIVYLSILSLQEELCIDW